MLWRSKPCRSLLMKELLLQEEVEDVGDFEEEAEVEDANFLTIKEHNLTRRVWNVITVTSLATISMNALTKRRKPR